LPGLPPGLEFRLAGFPEMGPDFRTTA